MRFLFFVLFIFNFAFLAENDSTCKYNDPHRTSYFFNSSAYSLKKGEKYARSIWFMPSLGFGISDNLSMQIIPIIPLSGRVMPAFISFKYSIPNLINNDKVHVALGLSGVPILNSYSGEISVLASIFSTITYGNKDNHISLSTALWTDGEIKAITPLLTLSAMQRLSANISWVGQLIPYDTNGPSFPSFTTNINHTGIYFGFRFFNKKTSVDIGVISDRIGPLWALTDMEEPVDTVSYKTTRIYIPMLGVSYYFN